MTRTPSKSPLKKLSLQPGIIYGPVASRRLGRSLGINLLPADYKLCSFNCLYCQYGWTKSVTLMPGDRLKDLPTPDAVATALKNALAEFSRRDKAIDAISICGNGEPTLYLALGEGHR
jgi:wyosine [tRNA(Phe)-imidazoG37] synthetase (radical SAM superfamily)